MDWYYIIDNLNGWISKSIRQKYKTLPDFPEESTGPFATREEAKAAAERAIKENYGVGQYVFYTYRKVIRPSDRNPEHTAHAKSWDIVHSILLDLPDECPQEALQRDLKKALAKVLMKYHPEILWHYMDEWKSHKTENRLEEKGYANQSLKDVLARLDEERSKQNWQAASDLQQDLILLAEHRIQAANLPFVFQSFGIWSRGFGGGTGASSHIHVVTTGPFESGRMKRETHRALCTTQDVVQNHGINTRNPICLQCFQALARVFDRLNNTTIRA